MTKKYRPYLSLPELRHLVAVLTQHEPTSGLCRYLSRYLLDVESGFRQANHHSKDGVAGKLGFSEDVPTKHESEQRYRYENDLMSPQEEYEYEVSQGLHR